MPPSHLSRLLSTAQNNAVGPLASRLASRSVIRFTGPDTVKFLQGLLTNDVRRLAGGAGESSPTSYLPTPNLNHLAPPPIYAALLSPQGRFLYDLFLYRPPRAEGMIDRRTGAGPGSADSENPFSLLADVDSMVVDELLDCLKKYRLRSKVDIENVAKELTCWQRFSIGNLASSEEPEAASIGWGMGADHTSEAAAQGSDQGWQWFKDPRLDCLGFRGIFPVDMTPPVVEADEEADERHYLAWRLEKGVAEGSFEIPKGEAIPLEYNLVGLNAVSFDKGCYVGQELIARTHHRGVIRKRLVPLRFDSKSGEDLEATVSPNSDIVDNTNGKKVGTVRAALGSLGMGLLRLEEVVNNSSTLTIKDREDVRVRATKPDWWPSEWTQMLEQKTVAA